MDTTQRGLAPQGAEAHVCSADGEKVCLQGGVNTYFGRSEEKIERSRDVYGQSDRSWEKKVIECG